MAIFANIAGPDVILVLANCIVTVVATNTIRRVIRMIEGCRYPSIGRMTGIAIVATCDVGWVLANRYGVVMTR